MRATSRPAAFTRQILNHFTAGTETFVELGEWDTCVDHGLRPVVADKWMSVWVGVDASTKRDSTAIVAVTWDKGSKKVRLVSHRIFQPTPAEPLDFESTVESELRGLRHRFPVRRVLYDPMQMVAVAQRLSGLPMEEFPQSLPNLTEAGQNLFDLIKGGNLAAYPDDEIRRAVSHTVAVETPRGWRISKEKTSHKIDVVAALSFAALACVRDAARSYDDAAARAATRREWNDRLRLASHHGVRGGRLFTGGDLEETTMWVARGTEGMVEVDRHTRKPIKPSREWSD